MTDAKVRERWRASAFVWIRGDESYHDLQDKRRHLDSTERLILTSGIDHIIDAEELSLVSGLLPDRLYGLIQGFSSGNWLVSEDADESTLFGIFRVDIETCRQCNASCKYCPQSARPKQPHVMAEDVFRLILSEIAPYRPKWVALNHYGEPLLDPLFRKRCEVLANYQIPLFLFTNATLLCDDTLHFLTKSCLLHGIVFNYPSIHPSEWAVFMGLQPRLHDRASSAIYTAVRLFSGPIEILVNGNTECQDRRLNEVSDLFKEYPHVSVPKWTSHDRAGVHRHLTISPPKNTSELLAGCAHIVGHMHFSSEGTAFLCCQDYDQSNILGHVRESSVGQIMTGNIARNLREQIFGMKAAHDNLICRSCFELRSHRVLDSDDRLSISAFPDR